MLTTVLFLSRNYYKQINVFAEVTGERAGDGLDLENSSAGGRGFY